MQIYIIFMLIIAIPNVKLYLLEINNKKILFQIKMNVINLEKLT